MFLFKSYEEAYGAHPDIDTWCANAVYNEYPSEGDEILAESVCHTSELPWEDAEVFKRIALAINGREILPIDQELSVPEIAKAVYKMHKVFPEEEFNDTVASFIAAQCVEEGYTVVPKVLAFVQPRIPVTQLTHAQQEVLEAKLRAVEEVLYQWP